MMNLGVRGLLLLLAIVLFIVGALMDNTSENKLDILYWGLAVFAAAHVVDALPLGNLGARRDRTDRV